MQAVKQGEKTVTEQEATSDTKTKAYTVADGKMAPTAVRPDTRIEEDVNMAQVSDKDLARAKKRCAASSTACQQVMPVACLLLDISACAVSSMSVRWCACHG